MPCFSFGCCCVQIERLSFLYVHLFTHVTATTKFAICSNITSWWWETGRRWKMRRHSTVNNLASACSARGSTQLLVVHSWRRCRWSQTQPGSKSRRTTSLIHKKTTTYTRSRHEADRPASAETHPDGSFLATAVFAWVLLLWAFRTFLHRQRTLMYVLA